MRAKKIIIVVTICSIMILLTQSINATEIINKDIRKIKELEITNASLKLNLYNHNVMNLINNSDTIKNLHDLFILVWDIISVFIGHNLISLTIARLCCCWFIFPIVVLYDLTYINISGGGFLSYFKECLNYFNVSEIIYSLGMLSILVLPLIYGFSFCLAILCVIENGFNLGGGMIAKIQEDLNYIYSPDISLSNYTTDDNVSGFKQYMKGFDSKLYFYNTGLSGLFFSIPFILYCKKCFNKFYNYNSIKKVDGIPDKPFLNFLLELFKTVLNFILSILNKTPI